MLLVEAGPDYPDFDTLPPQLKLGQAEGDVIPGGHLWDLVARFSEQQAPAPLARGKVVGGSSAVNGQVFLRGLPEDFQAWEEAGAEGWGFDQLLPIFRRIESDADFDDHWHGGDGPIRVRRYPRADWLPPQQAFHNACLAAGFPAFADANRPDAAGVGPIPFNNVDGIRQSVALSHLAAARGRPNLTIRAGSLVHRLRIRGRRVTGVEVGSEGRLEVLEAAEYVLSAGVIGSPHLLMLSGVGPAEQLRRAGVSVQLARPGVGQNLIDHQVADLTWQARAGAWVPPPRGPLLQVVLSYTADSSQLRNDMKVTVRSRLMGAQPAGAGVLAIVPGLYLPRSRGELRIVSSDAAVQPEIDFRFLAEEADRRRLREGVRLGRHLAEHPDLRPWTATALLPEARVQASDRVLDAWLARIVRSSQHACGTCRMGRESDPAAVVDPGGRVFGLDNLRVVDASVFPEPVRAHINATTVAVAERIVDLIRGAA